MILMLTGAIAMPQKLRASAATVVPICDRDRSHGYCVRLQAKSQFYLDRPFLQRIPAVGRSKASGAQNQQAMSRLSYSFSFL